MESTPTFAKSNRLLERLFKKDESTPLIHPVSNDSSHGCPILLTHQQSIQRLSRYLFETSSQTTIKRKKSKKKKIVCKSRDSQQGYEQKNCFSKPWYLILMKPSLAHRPGLRNEGRGIRKSRSSPVSQPLPIKKHNKDNRTPKTQLHKAHAPYAIFLSQFFRDRFTQIDLHSAFAMLFPCDALKLV